MLDRSLGGGDFSEDRRAPAVEVSSVVGLRGPDEVDYLSQELDVGWGQEAEDCQAGAVWVAVPVAVLGYEEAAVVVDADEVAGAHVWWWWWRWGSTGLDGVDGSVGFLEITGDISSAHLYWHSCVRGYRHHFRN